MEIKKITIELTFKDKIKADLEKFSGIISYLNKNYPLVEAVAPGIVNLSNYDSSEVLISLSMIRIEENVKENSEKTFDFLKSSLEEICKRLSITKFSHLIFRFIGRKKVVSEKLERPLFKNMSLKIPPKIKNVLKVNKFKKGFQIGYTHKQRDHFIRVEPLFRDLKYNLFIFTVEDTRENSIDEFFKIIDEECAFLKTKIKTIL